MKTIFSLIREWPEKATDGTSSQTKNDLAVAFSCAGVAAACFLNLDVFGLACCAAVGFKAGQLMWLALDHSVLPLEGREKPVKPKVPKLL